MKFVALIGSVFLFCGDAFANDAVPATEESSIRAELVEAVAAAKTIAIQRLAFTRTLTDLAQTPHRTFTARFDPSLPAGARWTAMDPPQSALSKEERKAFETMNKDDDADAALVYEGLEKSIRDASLISLSDSEALFRILIDDPEMTDEMRDTLVATARHDRKSNHIAAIEIASTKPFKPAPVAKIEKTRQLQRYAPVGPDGAVLMIASESEAEGKAFFKKFSSQTSIAYSDFAAVDAPPRAPKAK
jgi:hypothetical protein